VEKALVQRQIRKLSRPRRIPLPVRKKRWNGGWKLRFASNKDWDASIDGLYSPDDEATKMVAKALADGTYLCLKICKRIRSTANTKYVPLRMGLAIVTSDTFEAPNDDNTTYSMEFQGSGKPWLYETATEDQITAATVTVTND